MIYVEKKGLRLSKITLGTVQLGMPYGIANKSGQPNPIETRRLLKAAVDGGVLCFDTANAYGESENVLGLYFEHEPKPVFVSKMILKFDEETSNESIERQMMESVEHTLAKLKIACIPVMMLHNPGVLLTHGQIVQKCFQKLNREKLVKHAGISFGNDTNHNFAKYWRYVEDDLFAAVQIPMSILDHRLMYNGGFELLKRAKKLIFVRSVFLQGLLFLSPGELPEYMQAAEKPLRFLHSLAEREGISLAQLAVSYIRDLEGVDSLVIGAETAEQLLGNIQLINGPRLSEQTRFSIREQVGELPEELLNPFFWKDKYD